MVKHQTPETLDLEKLMHHTRGELLLHARALKIPMGSAEVFVDKSLKDAKKSLKNRKIITKEDFSRAVLKELTKYHADLAYVYKNYDKII